MSPIELGQVVQNGEINMEIWYNSCETIIALLVRVLGSQEESGTEKTGSRNAHSSVYESVPSGG